MPFKGKHLDPEEIAFYAAQHWSGEELVKAVAVCLAESQGFVGAFNDNHGKDGKVSSRDCGPYQINIPWSDHPTRDMRNAEAALRTESHDSTKWKAVVIANFARARKLYDSPWERHGKADHRRWQPWVAYTTGWAMFPEWYVWYKGIGPWKETGRYLHSAIHGVANYYASKHGIKIEGTHGLVWQPGAFPPGKPTAPPPNEGPGPRPSPNNGV